MTSCFSHQDARQFYNQFGAKQDNQGFYENTALDALIEFGEFSTAQSVLEFGCGTGKFAQRLLAHHLPKTARYTAVDISETMVELARKRLEPWSDRALVTLSNGGFDFSLRDDLFDRVVVTYVFDLLSTADISIALDAMRGAIRKDGYLCSAGISQGTGFPSSLTSTIWRWMHKLSPSIVGGCRPLVLRDLISDKQWRIIHRQVVVSATVPSEVLVAQAI